MIIIIKIARKFDHSNPVGVNWGNIKVKIGFAIKNRFIITGR